MAHWTISSRPRAPSPAQASTRGRLPCPSHLHVTEQQDCPGRVQIIDCGLSTYPEVIHLNKLGISVTGSTGQSDTLWFKGKDLVGACGQVDPGDFDPGGRHGGQVSTSGTQGRADSSGSKLRRPGRLPGGCGRACALCTPAHPEELTQWDKRSGLDHLRNHQARQKMRKHPVGVNKFGNETN